MDLLVRGGVLVVPILFCSVLAAAIFTERCIRFFLLRKRGLGVADRVSGLVMQGDRRAALELASGSRSPMGRILKSALGVVDQDREILETVINHAAEEEVRGLSRYLQTLATIANVTPILGLLGTVIGMIKAFMAIQDMGGKVNASVLAGGIWEALLTTALGLSVALPVMVAHSYLLGRVDKYEAGLQSGAVLFMKSLGRSARD